MTVASDFDRSARGWHSTAPLIANPSERPLPIAASMAWVASSRGHTYYRRGCSTANRLSPANLIYFRTEEEAQQAGYRRSTSRGC